MTLQSSYVWNNFRWTPTEIDQAFFRATFRIPIFISKKSLSLVHFLCLFLFFSFSLSMYNHVFDGIQYFFRKEMRLAIHCKSKKYCYCQHFVMVWRLWEFLLHKICDNAVFTVFFRILPYKERIYDLQHLSIFCLATNCIALTKFNVTERKNKKTRFALWGVPWMFGKIIILSSKKIYPWDKLLKLKKRIYNQQIKKMKISFILVQLILSATNTIFSIFNDLYLLYKKYATLEIDTIIFRGDINRYKADNLTIVINLHVFALVL